MRMKNEARGIFTKEEIRINLRRRRGDDKEKEKKLLPCAVNKDVNIANAVDDRGKSLGDLFFRAAYINRDNAEDLFFCFEEKEILSGFL